MNPNAWEQIKRFRREEFDYPDKLDMRLIVMADAMLVRETRYRPGLQFIVHNDYRPGDPKTHGMGWALDGHFQIKHSGCIKNLSIEDQFFICMRYPFGGVGIYPWWTHPGVHIDVKPRSLSDRRRMWLSPAEKDYLPVEDYFLKE